MKPKTVFWIVVVFLLVFAPQVISGLLTDITTSVLSHIPHK